MTILCATPSTGAIVLTVAIILFALFEIGSFVATLIKKKRKAKKDADNDKEVIDDKIKGEEVLNDDRSTDT